MGAPTGRSSTGTRHSDSGAALKNQQRQPRKRTTAKERLLSLIGPFPGESEAPKREWQVEAVIFTTAYGAILQSIFFFNDGETREFGHEIIRRENAMGIEAG